MAQVDRLLRGHYTRPADLREGKIEVPVRTLVVLGLVLGALYGVFMGLYAVLRPTNPSFAQLIVTALKVPLLFLLTLVVTFPSLYVFSALANSRLGSLDTLRLLLVAVSVNLALLASFGPVTGFFTLSTDSYPFMVTLNVVLFAAGGFVGLAFLQKALGPVFETPPPAPEEPEPSEGGKSEEESPESGSPQSSSTENSDAGGDDSPDEPPAPAPSFFRVESRERLKALARREEPAKRIFMVWTVIYMVVGAQMGWILRPFIGTPDMPFSLFRARQSSFFESFLKTLGRLFS
jgi:hypothetical protein